MRCRQNVSKRHCHSFDYFMMIIKHSRHPKLCCYCWKVNHNEIIFLLSLEDSSVSSLKMQDTRPNYHMRFSTTSTTCLAWIATCRYWKWWYWRKKVGIFIKDWLCIIHFRCITSKKLSQISLWVQSGISPRLMPTQILGSKSSLFGWWQTHLSKGYHKYFIQLWGPRYYKDYCDACKVIRWLWLPCMNQLGNARWVTR